jgi:hypothetical protein
MGVNERVMNPYTKEQMDMFVTQLTGSHSSSPRTRLEAKIQTEVSPLTTTPTRIESTKPASDVQTDQSKQVSEIDEHRARTEAEFAGEIAAGNINVERVRDYKIALNIAYTHFDLYKRGERLAQRHNPELQRHSAEFIQVCKEWTEKRLDVGGNDVGFPVQDNVIEALIRLNDSNANIKVLPGIASIVHNFMKPHVIVNNKLALVDWPPGQVTYPQNRSWWSSPPKEAFLYHYSQRVRESIDDLVWGG